MSLRTLYQTLLGCDSARLRVIALQWDIALHGEQRPDLAAQLADNMAESGAVERIWENLAPEPRAVLEDLLRNGGALPWAILTRRWGQVRNVGPGRLEREELWRHPVSAAEALWYLGLLFRTSILDDRGAPREMAFVPESLILYLPAPSPLEIPGPETIAPPARALPGTDDLGEDLVTLWSYLQSESVRLAEDGTWSEPHRAAFLSRFVQPVETRLRMIEHLAREQDWIHVDERGMLRPVPGPMMEWLRGGRQMQWATLARVWRDSVRWNDLAMAPSLGPDPLLDWPNDPAAARHNFLAHLQHCKAGVWYTLSNLVQHVYQYATDFLRPDGDYDAWNLQDRATGAPVKGFDSWYAVEGALIVFFVVGPLSWLGLVDLGWTLPGLPPDAFRINDAGAAFLGLDGSFELPEPPPVHIAPDGLLAAPPGRRYERFQLGRIAVQVSSGAAAQYRLTPRSLSRARAQRIPLERIVDFLDEATEGRLPAALRKAVERAYHGGVQARLGRVWVLRVEDPELLDYPEIRELLQERLGPRVALVRETDRERLLSLLVQEGILPELDER